jgi:UDP-3-O-[3-hydroxymyristoyl] glucosamine N-acyltransferase
MEKSIGEIAKRLGAKLTGNRELKIKGIRALSMAGPGDLSLMSEAKYLSEAQATKASALIVPKNISIPNKTFLEVEQPMHALAEVLEMLNPHPLPHPKGIHPTAIVGQGSEIGKDVAIGPYAVVGDHCRIGDRTILYGGVRIGPQTVVGSDCILYANVTLRERIYLGHRVIIHPGTVVGEDGFGFVSTADGHKKIPQIGDVRIEDDVEIGANCAIDRGTLESTIIGRGTKMGNLILVGHNVVIGENCLLAGDIALGGSVVLGNNCVLGGQVGIRDHVRLADGVRLAARSGVGKDLTQSGDYMGSPAKEAETFFKIQACLNRLPELIRQWEQMQNIFNAK